MSDANFEAQVADLYEILKGNDDTTPIKDEVRKASSLNDTVFVDFLENVLPGISLGSPLASVIFNLVTHSEHVGLDMFVSAMKSTALPNTHGSEVDFTPISIGTELCPLSGALGKSEEEIKKDLIKKLKLFREYIGIYKGYVVALRNTDTPSDEFKRNVCFAGDDGVCKSPLVKYFPSNCKSDVNVPIDRDTMERLLKELSSASINKRSTAHVYRVFQAVAHNLLVRERNPWALEHFQKMVYDTETGKGLATKVEQYLTDDLIEKVATYVSSGKEAGKEMEEAEDEEKVDDTSTPQGEEFFPMSSFIGRVKKENVMSELKNFREYVGKLKDDVVEHNYSFPKHDMNQFWMGRYFQPYNHDFPDAIDRDTMERLLDELSNVSFEKLNTAHVYRVYRVAEAVMHNFVIQECNPWAISKFVKIVYDLESKAGWATKIEQYLTDDLIEKVATYVSTGKETEEKKDDVDTRGSTEVNLCPLNSMVGKSDEEIQKDVTKRLKMFKTYLGIYKGYVVAASKPETRTAEIKRHLWCAGEDGECKSPLVKYFPASCDTDANVELDRDTMERLLKELFSASINKRNTAHIYRVFQGVAHNLLVMEENAWALKSFQKMVYDAESREGLSTKVEQYLTDDLIEEVAIHVSSRQEAEDRIGGMFKSVWRFGADEILQLSRREYGLAEGRIVMHGPHIYLTLHSKSKKKDVLFQIDPLATESIVSASMIDFFGPTQLYVENYPFSFATGGECVIAKDLLEIMNAKLTLDYKTKKAILTWS